MLCWPFACFVRCSKKNNKKKEKKKSCTHWIFGSLIFEFSLANRQYHGLDIKGHCECENLISFLRVG